MVDSRVTEIDALIARARAEGLLPRHAVRPWGESRPWPVVLLTALGAWLAAIPLFGVVAMLLGPLLDNAVGPYVAGVLLLAGALVVLRSAQVPLFVEQLAVPGLLVGLGALSYGFFGHVGHAAAALLLAALEIGLALALRQAWLQAVLGSSAASLVTIALVDPSGSNLLGTWDLLWLATHAVLAVALSAPWWQGRWRGHGAALDALLAGWWITTLVTLAALAGMTFLVGGVWGSFVGDGAREAAEAPGWRVGWRFGWDDACGLVSALAAAAALGVQARAWPRLRHPALLVAALCAMALAFFMTTLGGVLLGMACLLVTGRGRLAAAAAVAAAWIVGAFYYALAWDLATKALVLVAAGAVIGGVAWWLRAPREAVAGAPARAFGARAGCIALATAATLAVALGAIWQKQQVIRHGMPVYVALAPVDPRSLMQGDYMRLEFRVPAELAELPPGLGAERPKVVARRDARGVATLLRVARRGEALAEGEFLFELTPKDGRWMLVSDAWYFREGDAGRWERARFGEFRVMQDGRALLVGMADEKLVPIEP